MKKLFVVLGLLFLTLPVLASAAEFRTENVSESEDVRNLYVGGQNVNIDPNVGGDVTAGGNIVNLNGNVEKGAVIGGANVNLRGNVGDYARVAGGTINIDGNVGEDLLVFGGQITIGKDSTIEHDIVMAGGSIVINGTVKGRVYGSAGQFFLNGTVDGDVELKNVGQVTLGKDAKVGGNLKYSSPNKANIDEGKVDGKVEFTQVSRRMEKSESAKGVLFGFSILGLIGSFVLLLVLTLVAPKASKNFLATAVANPWLNIGVGFVTLVVVPIALFFLLITIVGAPIAGISFLGYILLLALAGTYSALIAGSWLVKVFKRDKEYEIGWLPVLLGVLTVLVLKFIPILGWLTVFVLFLISFGAMTRMLYNSFQAQR